MPSTDRFVRLSFFQEHSRQIVPAGHHENWTVAVLRDNEPLGRLAPWLFSSSEGLWRAAAWVSFHHRSRSGRRWQVVSYPCGPLSHGLADQTVASSWFADRDDACWWALRVSRDLVRSSGRQLADPRCAPISLRLSATSWARGAILGIAAVVLFQLAIVVLLLGMRIQDWMPLADTVIGATVGLWSAARLRRRWLTRQRERASAQLPAHCDQFPEWCRQ